jgi:hypothetical protein
LPGNQRPGKHSEVNLKNYKPDKYSIYADVKHPGAADLFIEHFILCNLK